ncbi:unnamed protein product [Kuraishia capsulata CBS 1993]|uniref:Post-GPI attachment to proteins factor 3 n=1 Tax=Kuraishia capsulata CBS 1993 TaxID=1382522 RepID=W6MGY4_9ASCO|nr:uncharacterized protein KUCA_T00001133001 [Kuraishia capsulata CBS 1993]CDK25166.1 unnamed protein product [Kuraishia capsulata CBS 1993]
MNYISIPETAVQVCAASWYLTTRKLIVISSEFQHIMKLILWMAVLLVKPCFGSLGDQLDEFQDCVTKCRYLTCPYTEELQLPSDNVLSRWYDEEEEQPLFDKQPLALTLRLLGWGCPDNCDYRCQRLITVQRQQLGDEVYQFHGKWPFIRVFGIQELFSTIFSILNFFPHYHGFRLMLAHYRQDRFSGSKFANQYFAYGIVGLVAMFAWIFSTIFHLRDTWDRERLDYFFAGATVLSGLYGITVRVFELYEPQNNTKRRAFGLLVVLMYIGHVARLLVDWSYTYNMEANVLVGLVQYVLWIYHAINSFQIYRQRASKVLPAFRGSKNGSNQLKADLLNKDVNWTLIPLLLVASVSFGMSFELFDFAPFFDLVDAHALWHFVTIWPAWYWYDYMVQDVENLKLIKSD